MDASALGLRHATAISSTLVKTHRMHTLLKVGMFDKCSLYRCGNRCLDEQEVQINFYLHSKMFTGRIIVLNVNFTIKASAFLSVDWVSVLLHSSLDTYYQRFAPCMANDCILLAPVSTESIPLFEKGLSEQMPTK